MICRLWEFKNDTDCQLDIEDRTLCLDTCKYYDGGCSCCEDMNVVLTHNIHGWTISRRLILKPTVVSGGQLRGTISAIKLINASVDSIWITVREKDDKILFLVVSGNTIKVCDTLGEVNFILKDTYDYDGRAITEEDLKYDDN